MVSLYYQPTKTRITQDSFPWIWIAWSLIVPYYGCNLISPKFPKYCWRSRSLSDRADNQQICQWKRKVHLADRNSELSFELAIFKHICRKLPNKNKEMWNIYSPFKNSLTPQVYKAFVEKTSNHCRSSTKPSYLAPSVSSSVGETVRIFKANNFIGNM